jgi:hypothetical protein
VWLTITATTLTHKAPLMTYQFSFSFTELSQHVFDALAVWEVWCMVRDELCFCDSAADVEMVMSDLGLIESGFEQWS